MRHQWKRPRIKRRHTSLKATNAGPVLALLSVILGILAIIALILFVALPKLLPLVGIDYVAPFQPTPKPTPQPRPTPVVHFSEFADISEIQHEMILPIDMDYHWFGDPSIWDNELLFTAGNAENGTVSMNVLLSYDLTTEAVQTLHPPLENDSYLYPAMNDRWLVYLDAKSKGGGSIKVVSRTDSSAKAKTLKTVYTGHPRLVLDGDYLVWTERTGTRMDKLFACDLNTFETTTVQMFNNSIYGLSAPSLSGGELIYADEDPNHIGEDAGPFSAIYQVKFSQGKLYSYSPGTYVHDPKTNGMYWAWMTGNHGEDSDLYCVRQNGRDPVLVAEGIVEFGMSKKFIAYGVGEATYVYFFDDGSVHKIHPDREKTQFLAVSGDYVIWMDVTSRERDILKYAKVS